MKYGLTETTVEKICAVFARFPEIEKAILYGSRAKGNFKTGSDIDLTLCGEALTSDLCSTIASALDDLLLPYTIDLSVFNELNHAKLREHIERVGVLFYERAKQVAAMKAGWQRMTIGDVCDVVNGGTPKTGVSAYWDGPYQWITPAEMGKRSSPYIGRTERTITDEGLQNSSARLLPSHSVILSSRAPIGHLVINTEPMATNQGCKGLIPGGRIDSKFLFYYLTSIVAQLNDLGTGATFKELSGGKMKEVAVPVPPLPEQQRIVGILDEVFDGIATAKANAEKNLQNARALFESHLQSVFTQRGEGWVEKKLGDICQFENGDRGKNYPNRAEYVESGIPWINTGHIQSDGTLSKDDMNYITRKKFDSLRGGKIQAGDLVYCLRGATLGKTAFVEPLAEGAVASSLVIIRPSRILNRRFLYYFLISPVGQGLIKLYENGAAQPNLGAKSVAKYQIAFPDLEEQQRIVSQLDALAAETQHLTWLYERRLVALEALKKSLLHQAFTGQL
ncbi:MAG: restriction endonuclease subunit S [Smithellaceae bacterium]|nr:restriction endonuclease subunit S [Smithellaceae bacterium]